MITLLSAVIIITVVVVVSAVFNYFGRNKKDITFNKKFKAENEEKIYNSIINK